MDQKKIMAINSRKDVDGFTQKILEEWHEMDTFACNSVGILTLLERL